jgi:hypothetical protein
MKASPEPPVQPPPKRASTGGRNFARDDSELLTTPVRNPNPSTEALAAAIASTGDRGTFFLDSALESFQPGADSNQRLVDQASATPPNRFKDSVSAQRVSLLQNLIAPLINSPSPSRSSSGSGTPGSVSSTSVSSNQSSTRPSPESTPRIGYEESLKMRRIERERWDFLESKADALAEIFLAFNKKGIPFAELQSIWMDAERLARPPEAKTPQLSDIRPQ